MKLRNLIISTSAGILLALPLAPIASAVTGADWRAGRIIDDPIFTDNGSMSISDIQNFLNQKVGTGSYGTPGVCDTNGVKTSELGGGTRAQYGAARGNPAPFTCLKDYYEVPKLTPGPDIPASNYGGVPIPAGAKSAANLIFDAAQAYNISPKVLLVTIQKESVGPLITDDWPLKSQYTYAMGAHCPDSGPGGSANCDVNYSGFSLQIAESAALLRYYLTNMSQPWWPYKKLGDNSIRYSPNSSCGSSNVNIETSATAALYTYTPYQPNQAALNNLYGTGDGCSAYGNRNFWRMYNDWFGKTIGPPDYSCRTTSAGANIPGEANGEIVLSRRLARGNPDLLTLGILNNTGTGCLEMHTWVSSLQQWLSHTASNRTSAAPSDSDLITVDLDGDGLDNIALVEYEHTATGMIQVHIWDGSNQKFIAHIATNRPTINRADADIISADTNGDGRDELYLIQYRNTASGRVEIHGWTDNLQGWFLHVATNYSSIDPATSRVIASDINGDGKDEFFLINYTGTASGAIEVHGWTNNFQSWFMHTATSHYAISPADARVISSDTNGDGKDEMLLIKYRNTGSGRIEVHGWLPGLQGWFMHTAATP